MDFMKAIGTNTQTLVSVDAMMATMISLVPLNAASFGSRPWSSFMEMFSRTTIALVTRSPTALESAISVIMLMVKSAKYMNVNAPMTEIGIVTAAMNIVLKRPRKRSRMMAVRAMAISMFEITLSSDSWTFSAWLYTRFIL